jgi:hypothetical protein
MIAPVIQQRARSPVESIGMTVPVTQSWLDGGD